MSSLRAESAAGAVEAEAQARVAGDPGVAELRALTHVDDAVEQTRAELQLRGLPLAQGGGDVAVGLTQRGGERPPVGGGLRGAGGGVRAGGAGGVADQRDPAV